MNKGFTMPGGFYKGPALAFQGSMMASEKMRRIPITISEIVQVAEVNSDEGRCKCRTDTTDLVDIPMLTKGGLVDGEVYGELDMPCVDDLVVVGFLGGNSNQPYILGVIIPYLDPAWGQDNVAVNSGSKAYTKKLLEAGKEGHYRKIHKSGTTVEIMEDGSAVVETPKGMFVYLDDANDKIIAQVESGVDIVMEKGVGVNICGTNLEVLK